MKLANQKIVIIGGSSGIGLGVAMLAHAEGARVVIGGRDLERLEYGVERIGRNASHQQVDITDHVALGNFFEEIGPFDHLVCTSHGSSSSVVPGVFRDIVDLDITASREFMEAKFWGPFMATRFAVKHINPRGSITLTSGCASRVWLEKHGIMGAVNSAVEGFIKKAAHELGPIRVNAVVPSLTDTPAFDGLPPDVRDAYFKMFAARLPVRQVASCADIAQAYVFLMTSTQMSGAWLDIDGGNNVW